MVIRVEQAHCGRTPVLEYSRDGVPTVYLLDPSLAGEIDKIRNENAKWRLVRQVAVLKRKKREGEP